VSLSLALPQYQEEINIMPISITISPEAAVQAGARWRVLDGSGQGGQWLGSGEVATGLEPCRYQIEFAPLSGWKEPQGLGVRNVEGYTNCKTAAYRPLSFYELGKIPPQTAWHDQLLEFMIPIDEARAIDVSGEPRPDGELFLDRVTGLFRYKPAPDDKFPFLVTLAHKDGGKKQAFEVTPMPILPPEVDVFGGRPIPQDTEALGLQMAPLTVTPPIVALNQGQEPPPPDQPFSIVEPIVTSTFIETQPALEPSVPTAIASTPSAPRVMAFPSSTYKAERPTIDTVENEAELFNNELRTTRSIRIVGDNVILEKGLDPYDAIHENPAIKRLDLYAETVTIRSPLHLPQTTVSIYARELRFEDQADSPSYLSTTPVDYLTSAKPATRQATKDAKGQVIKDATGRETYTIIPPADGLPGAKAGDVFLRIEYYHAPDSSKKRFILTGGRGQNPGAGLDGRDGSKMEEKETYYQAKPGGFYKIVYGIHYSKGSGFEKTKHHPWGVKAWPTDGENATPAGIPGPGGDGGALTSTQDLASQIDGTGGDPGRQDRVYNGGAPGEPQYSVMVESWNKHEEPFGPHSWGWNYLQHPGWNLHSGNWWGYRTKAGSPAVSPAGKNGNPGRVTRVGHPLSWLHPLLLQEALERAKNIYLNGGFEAAEEKIAEYAGLLDIYQSLEAWNDLDDAAKLELGQIRNEMAGFLARLNSHLDYFGNPAGWVPMLSFEVNRTIFDNEIDRAIEVLYLAYWLREKAQDDKQRVDALEQLQGKLKQEIEDLKGRYTKATAAVPELEVQAGKISNEMNLLQEKLKNLEEELRQKAEEKLEEPWWKTGLKLAGTLCTVLPVYQPALGAVGGLMNLGADFEKDDPWKTIIGAADIAKVYGDEMAEKVKGAASILSGKVDPKSAEFVAKESAEALQGWTSALSDGLKGVNRILAEREAPKSEVDALLAKLEAESEEFKQLSGEISTLLERKMDFAQKLADALQVIAEIPNTITKNLLAIDSADSAMAEGKSMLHDERLTLHLNAMDRRARERLLKYHYYLAKSYEYRLLHRYPGTLDLDKVFEEMERLAQLNMQGDKPYQLSKEQFDSLKGVYQDVLSSLAEEIFDIYNGNPSELSAPRRFSLFRDEIDRLNAGERISLNLMDLGLFRLSEENVRIVDLELESPEVSMEGGGERRLAELDLRFEHSGISQLRQGGRAIRFCHSAREKTNSIAWGARYDVVDKKIDPIKPSAASDSLLRSLLKSDTAGTIMLYSQPAVWANITVSREVNADPGTAIKIEALRLNMRYDFTRKSPGVHIIQVQAAPESANLRPYFIVDQVDLTGRKDGRGAFYRAYKGLPTAVQLLAQDRYGQWRFDQWTDQAGNTLGKNRSLTVRVEEDQVLRAVYLFAR
jgi:hypothetical protein